MKTVMLVFGTRPGVIKMYPLVNELKCQKEIRTMVCVTGQHRQMLDQVLGSFSVTQDHGLSVMKTKQTLFGITVSVLERIKGVLEGVRPYVVFVHWDTFTIFVTALACFYMQISEGHMDSGFRTHNIFSPYPEEFSRQAVSIVSWYDFAPTETAKENMLAEGRATERICVAGNMVTDTLKTTVRESYTRPGLDWAAGSRLILITAHRRETLGEPMKYMFRAIRLVRDEHGDVTAIYPIHMNPVARVASDAEMGGGKRIYVIGPLDVLAFHNFMVCGYLILTDPGGIQEEGPSLGKPVPMMWNTTKRSEGIAVGTLKLVGAGEQTVYTELTRLLDDETAYNSMTHLLILMAAVTPAGGLPM